MLIDSCSGCGSAVIYLPGGGQWPDGSSLLIHVCECGVVSLKHNLAARWSGRRFRAVCVCVLLSCVTGEVWSRLVFPLRVWACCVCSVISVLWGWGWTCVAPNCSLTGSSLIFVLDLTARECVFWLSVCFNVRVLNREWSVPSTVLLRHDKCVTHTYTLRRGVCLREHRGC